jgi:hypothetical protein
VRRVLTALVLALVGGRAGLPPAPAAAQEPHPRASPSLGDVAEAARRAWFRHDAAGFIATSPSVLVRLPGAEPSGAVSRAQAAALLRDYLAAGEEVATVLVAAEEVEPGRGYVELERRYRVAGTQEVRTETLLLSYRDEGRGWGLVELRVVG